LEKYLAVKTKQKSPKGCFSNTSKEAPDSHIASFRQIHLTFISFISFLMTELGASDFSP
jgi:hypothetical protein